MANKSNLVHPRPPGLHWWKQEPQWLTRVARSQWYSWQGLLQLDRSMPIRWWTFQPIQNQQRGWVSSSYNCSNPWITPGLVDASWSMFGPSLIALALILRRRRGAKALPILGSNRRKLEGRSGRCHYGSSDMHQCRAASHQHWLHIWGCSAKWALGRLVPLQPTTRTIIYLINQPLDFFWAAPHSSRELHLAMDWWLTRCGRQLKYASLPFFASTTTRTKLLVSPDLLIHSCTAPPPAQPAPVHHCANEWGRGLCFFTYFAPFGVKAMKAAAMLAS